MLLYLKIATLFELLKDVFVVIVFRNESKTRNRTALFTSMQQELLITLMLLALFPEPSLLPGVPVSLVWWLQASLRETRGPICSVRCSNMI